MFANTSPGQLPNYCSIYNVYVVQEDFYFNEVLHKWKIIETNTLKNCCIGCFFCSYKKIEPIWRFFLKFPISMQIQNKTYEETLSVFVQVSHRLLVKYTINGVVFCKWLW